MIAGVCLLALTFTITEALERKQDANECFNLGTQALSCLNDLAAADLTPICNGNCRSILENYYDTCNPPARELFDQACDSVNNGGDGHSAGCDAPSNRVQSCLADLTGLADSVCNGSCQAILDDYYSDCDPSGTGREAYDTFCDPVTNGGDNNICGTAPSADILSCLSSSSSDPTSVCSSSCRSVLEDYFNECDPTGTATGTLDRVCDGGEDDGGDNNGDGDAGDNGDNGAHGGDNNNGGNDVGYNGIDGDEGDHNGGGDDADSGNGDRGNSAATGGATILTIVSAVLIAVGN